MVRNGTCIFERFVSFLRVSEGYGFDFSSWRQAIFTEAPQGYFQSLQNTVSCAITVFHQSELAVMRLTSK
jgi:hypothetical protein